MTSWKTHCRASSFFNSINLHMAKGETWRNLSSRFFGYKLKIVCTKLAQKNTTPTCLEISHNSALDHLNCLIDQSILL